MSVGCRQQRRPPGKRAGYTDAARVDLTSDVICSDECRPPLALFDQALDSTPLDSIRLDSTLSARSYLPNLHRSGNERENSAVSSLSTLEKSVPPRENVARNVFEVSLHAGHGNIWFDSPNLKSVVYIVKSTAPGRRDRDSVATLLYGELLLNPIVLEWRLSVANQCTRTFLICLIFKVSFTTRGNKKCFVKHILRDIRLKIVELILLLI